MSAPNPLIVHDYLLQHGGAERVVDVLMSAYPRAPLVTSLAGPEYRRRYGARLHTSSLQRFPVDATSFRALMPLYARAFNEVPLPAAEVVICSSSGWAHGVTPRLSVPSIVYCHTPARWLWRGAEYFQASRLRHARGALEPVLSRLRARDLECARAATHYVANSAAIAARIRRCYGLEASIVHPPVAIERFRCDRPREEFYLVVSRLLDYKRIDLAVAACTQLRRRLVVVGTGPALSRLRASGGPTVSFVGARTDEQVNRLMERCRALIIGAEEDFGIAAVEAMAAGAPVLGFGRGGVTETVTDSVTGILFERQDVRAAVAGIRRLEALDLPAARQADAAGRFGSPRFVAEMAAVVDRVVAGASPQVVTKLRA
jgi:glycosyltransferase involved in cell wall biosynthesis